MKTQITSSAFEQSLDSLSAPMDDPCGSFCLLAKYLRDFRNEHQKGSSKLDAQYITDASNKIDALLLAYNHDQIDISCSLKYLFNLLNEYFSGYMEEHFSPSTQNNWSHKLFLPGHTNINILPSKYLDNFNKGYPSDRDFFGRPKTFWNQMCEEFIYVPRLTRTKSTFSEGFGGNDIENKINSEKKLSKVLLKRFEDCFNASYPKLDIERFQKLNYAFIEKSFFKRSQNKLSQEFEIDYYNNLDKQVLLGNVRAIVDGYKNDKVKIKKHRKKLDKLEEFIGSEKYSFEADQKRTKFLESLPDNMLRYTTPENDPESIEKIDKILDKYFHHDLKAHEHLNNEDYEKILNYAKKEHEEWLWWKHFFSNKKERNIYRYGFFDFVPDELFSSSKNVEEQNEDDLQELISELLFQIEQNPFFAIEIFQQIKEINNALMSKNENQEKGDELSREEHLNFFWNYISELAEIKFHSMIHKHQSSMAFNMLRIYIFTTKAILLCKNFDEKLFYENSSFYFYEILQDIQSLTEYFQNHLTELINASGQVSIFEKLYAWNTINNLKSIESYHKSKINIILAEKDVLSIDDVYLLASISLKDNLNMPKFLTADNLDEYAEGRLPQKNHRKNRLNFIRQEVSKGHLKTASQKSKKGNKKQSVSDGFKLDDVASWLQKRRGIKLERPDLIEVENIHDVFSFFLEIH